MSQNSEFTLSYLIYIEKKQNADHTLKHPIIEYRMTIFTQNSEATFC